MGKDILHIIKKVKNLSNLLKRDDLLKSSGTICGQARLDDLTFEIIEKISASEFNKNKDLVNEILQYDSSSAVFLPPEERAFPGDKYFYESGHYKRMFSRYFFAGSAFCRGKKVMDSCSGLGWGAHIIAKYADKVSAIDLNESIVEFCKKTWKDKNVDWLLGDALDLALLGSGQFDTVLAMETIEHFTRDDGEKYVEQIANILKKGGYLVGTSAFPSSRDEAEKIMQQNKYHLYIFTEKELGDLLDKYFARYKIINNWMFIAQR